MGTMTAEWMVGHGHPNHGGIFGVTHRLQLHENSMPVYELREENEVDGTLRVVKRWFPTVENMMLDGLVMISLYVLKDLNVVRYFHENAGDPESGEIMMYDQLEEEKRQELYKLSMAIPKMCKMMVLIYEGSTLAGQTMQLKGVGHDIEVLRTAYRKEYNQWSEEEDEVGSLA